MHMLNDYLRGNDPINISYARDRYLYQMLYVFTTDSNNKKFLDKNITNGNKNVLN